MTAPKTQRPAKYIVPDVPTGYLYTRSDRASRQEAVGTAAGLDVVDGGVLAGLGADVLDGGEFLVVQAEVVDWGTASAVPVALDRMAFHGSMIPAVRAGNTVPVIRPTAAAVVAAAILAAATLTGLALSGARADEPQLLAVDLSGAAPRIERRDAYDTQLPIRVRVYDPQAQRVGIQGVGPDGTTLDLLLARAEDGFYTGTLELHVPGDWSLAIDTTDGQEDALTEHFTISAKDFASSGEADVMLALCGVSICSGISLIAVGRRAAGHAVLPSG